MRNVLFYLIMWSSNLRADVFKAVTKTTARAFNHIFSTPAVALTAQKMKFSITDFFNKCDQIRR